MESWKRGIFVYIELLEITNVIGFRILESIDTGRSESLKGVSVELPSDFLRFSLGKMLVPLEKRKLLKPEFIRKIPEFDCSENGALDCSVNIYMENFVFLFHGIVHC